VSVGLRRAADLVSGHICKCGVTVLPSGHHGLSHAIILPNDIIARALQRIDIVEILEPQDIIRGDGKRPDESTLIPLFGGMSVDPSGSTLIP